MTEVQAAEDATWTINGAGGINAPVKGSQHYSCSPARWQATGAEGFWIKPLADVHTVHELGRVRPDDLDLAKGRCIEHAEQGAYRLAFACELFSGGTVEQ